MKKLNREYRTRAHVHHMVAAEPGIIAICGSSGAGVEPAETWTLERDVPAWGVYDIIVDIYEDGVLKVKEYERAREAGPLVWVCNVDGEADLVPASIVEHLLRVERNGIPLTDRHHRTARVIDTATNPFADEPSRTTSVVRRTSEEPEDDDERQPLVSLTADPGRAILRYRGNHVIIDARAGAVWKSTFAATAELIDRLELINQWLASPQKGTPSKGFGALMLRYVWVDIYGTVDVQIDFLHDNEQLTDVLLRHRDPMTIHPAIDSLRMNDQAFDDGHALTISMKITKCSPESDHFSRLDSDYYRQWTAS